MGNCNEGLSMNGFGSASRNRGKSWRSLTASTLLAVAFVFATSTFAQAATPAWKLLAVTGPTHLAPFVGERQAVTVTGSASGTFTLGFAGDTTPSLPYGAPATGPGSVQEELNALPSIAAGGGSVSVASVLDITTNQRPQGGRRLVVTFDGEPLAESDVPALVGAGSGGVSVDVADAPSGVVVVDATNVGGAASDGTATTIEFDLPAGITAIPSAECAVVGQHVTCSNANVISPLHVMPDFTIPLIVGPSAPSNAVVDVTAQGGGASGVSTYEMPIVVSTVPAGPGVQAMWAGAFDEDGEPFTQAAGHPASAGVGFRLNTVLSPIEKIATPGEVKDLDVNPPAGFIGNPLVTNRCPQGYIRDCGDGATLGNTTPLIQVFTKNWVETVEDAPLDNTVPARGYAAQFSFNAFAAKVSIMGSLRPDDFGVQAWVPNITTSYQVYGGVTMLDGAPATAAGSAFLTNPTECIGQQLPTLMAMNTWQEPGVFSDTVSDLSPAVTGCSLVPFDPSVDIASTSTTPDSASGLEFGVEIPQEGLLDPSQIAQSHVDDVTVDLPAGLAVNPSGATGLQSCSDAQMAQGEKSAPDCPDGSKLGTVEVTSPLVDHPVGGAMYLGTPKSTDPMSGEMLRLWVVARDDESGTMVKLPGSATADPASGKLTATFENNPRVPFDHLEVKLRGGDQGLLATPQTCGGRSLNASLSPWSGNEPVERSSPLDIAGACSFGFAPILRAGSSNNTARGTGTFAFRFTRQDGEQWVDGLTAKLPEGLLATLKGLQLCSSGQAASGACPGGSRIGTVDGSAGSGDPFVLEQKGSAYLTEGYKGCPYGMAVKVPVVAGPFDRSSPATDLGDIVVRQKVCVDPTTAEVSVISDPLPTIWHGIPLRVRSVTVSIDRPGFMLNPSDCSQKQIDGVFDSDRGTASPASSPFSAVGCSSLPFRPSLALALTGHKQVTTGRHPGVKAQVNQAGVGEAGVERVVVRLPKSLALDPNNAQALCEFEAGTKPDLENHCPKGSIVGRAKAVTPLLNRPLTGNVYFVKNVRRDSNTGNLIRTLPMIIVALRGEIAINLRGESSTTKAGKLVNTFANVPDGPISQFNMYINGGRNGILAVTRTRKAKINLCAGRHVAEADTDGQNGRRHDTNIRMKTPCTRKQTKAAKRAAAKARKARRS